MSPPVPVEEPQEQEANYSETQEEDQEQGQKQQINEHPKYQRKDQQLSSRAGIKKHKPKTTFKRIDVDPSRRYHTPEARESWGPNVKGKKFRKEKGKKKRSTGTGARIDGAVKSVRLS